MELGLFLELVQFCIVFLEQIEQLLVVVLSKLNVLVSIIESIFHEFYLGLLVGSLELNLDGQVIEVVLHLHELTLGFSVEFVVDLGFLN